MWPVRSIPADKVRPPLPTLLRQCTDIGPMVRRESGCRAIQKSSDRWRRGLNSCDVEPMQVICPTAQGLMQPHN